MNDAAAKRAREDAPAWDGERFGQRQDSARLYVLIARAAPVAAVLRRGPGTQTALLKWDLETDELTLGQWVQSRVYERRCDLSPDGKYFMYFAARHKGPLNSWTAVSILPWFRACVLWQKNDAWGGGGFFGEDGNIELNHRPNVEFEYDIHMGHLPKPWKSYGPRGEYSGGGEDEPIQTYRQAHEGWEITERPSKVGFARGGPFGWVTEGALVREKHGPDDVVLRMIDDEHSEANGRSYLTECQIVRGDTHRSFGRVDWADWHGDTLLFARNGCLWRLSALFEGAPELVADLNAMTYEAIKAPYAGAQKEPWTP